MRCVLIHFHSSASPTRIPVKTLSTRGERLTKSWLSMEQHQARATMSTDESKVSAFTPVLNQKSPSHEVEREAFHWRPPAAHSAPMTFAPHLWSAWSPYPTAMEHTLKAANPPLWPPLCTFGGPSYPSFFKERMYRLAACSEEEKPSHSYIGLIAEAILSAPEEKLILSDIYNYILSHYPYFRNKGTGWRNSIRHNLSLNDCFMKAGRSPNGKGHFWAINPLYYEDFRRGDFRRRRTQKRTAKSRRTSSEVKDEPVVSAVKLEEIEPEEKAVHVTDEAASPKPERLPKDEPTGTEDGKPTEKPEDLAREKHKSFDVESLLAPDRGQREGLVLSFLPRPYDPTPVLCSPCSGYSSPEFGPGSPFERGQFFTYAEASRYPMFPYRITCWGPLL